MIGLDARQPPPDDLRTLFKEHQRASLSDLIKDSHIVDFSRGQCEAERQGLKIVASIDSTSVRLSSPQLDCSDIITTPDPVDVFEPSYLPGLYASYSVPLAQDLT